MKYKVEILPIAWEDLKQIGETVFVYHIADTQTEYTKLFD